MHQIWPVTQHNLLGIQIDLLCTQIDLLDPQIDPWGTKIDILDTKIDLSGTKIEVLDTKSSLSKNQLCPQRHWNRFLRPSLALQMTKAKWSF